jgi:hypothetical protein
VLAQLVQNVSFSRLDLISEPQIAEMELCQRQSSFQDRQLKGQAAAPGSAAFALEISEARLNCSSSETSIH